MKVLRTFGKELATITLLGVFVWGGIYLWQATPTLLLAVGPAALLMAALWAVFFLGAAFLFGCAALFWLSMWLMDRHHYYETRKRHREEHLRQQALQDPSLLVEVAACPNCSCSHSPQNDTN